MSQGQGPPEKLTEIRAREGEGIQTNLQAGGYDFASKVIEEQDRIVVLYDSTFENFENGQQNKINKLNGLLGQAGL